MRRDAPCDATPHHTAPHRTNTAPHHSTHHYPAQGFTECCGPPTRGAPVESCDAVTVSPRPARRPQRRAGSRARKLRAPPSRGGRPRSIAASPGARGHAPTRARMNNNMIKNNINTSIDNNNNDNINNGNVHISDTIDY